MNTQAIKKAQRPSNKMKANQIALMKKTKLIEVIDNITDINGLELNKIELSPKGEFINCSTESKAKSVCQHLKSYCRSRGFKVGVLEQYLMIVPRVHKEFDVPDFSAYDQPDFKHEFAYKLLGVKEKHGKHEVANSEASLPLLGDHHESQSNSKKALFILGAALTIVGGVLGFLASIMNQNNR